MALDTYDNLKSAIKLWLSKGTELDGFLDDFIDIAEARMRREVRMRDMLTTSSPTLANGDRTEDLPSDFLAAKHFRVLNPYNTAAIRMISGPVGTLTSDIA